MPWPIPTLADVFRARRVIAPYLRPSPVIEPDALGAALGCRAVLKCENLLPTGAFKVRGGIHLLARTTDEERRRGVLTVSTGNHAQSVAYAARLFGVSAVVFMPEGANPVKVAATRGLGAEVIFRGSDYDEARAAAEALAATAGRRYIHSTNEPLLVAGVATGALELLEEVPDIDVLVVPTGGGSGVLGAGVVARAVNPAIRVVGVQAEGAPALYRSFTEGRRVVTESIDTFAEGLATREPFAMALEWLPQLVDEMMLVSDAEIAAAIRLLFESTRLVAEGAGAAGIAAVVRRRADWAGMRVGIMLTGGNIPTSQFLQILGG